MDGLKKIHRYIIKTTIKNKVFRKGTIDGLKVVAIIAYELNRFSLVFGNNLIIPKNKGFNSFFISYLI
ncbi:hypothetical protein [Caminicella sporogenes]|uniref:hypothetical protein n=1 Tax=Caminicella sporogenes TaxID=166485 RepID=UPI001A9B9E58|nr:hypothetical protein [Caminicella sporogenes]